MVNSLQLHSVPERLQHHVPNCQRTEKEDTGERKNNKGRGEARIVGRQGRERKTKTKKHQ